MGSLWGMWGGAGRDEAAGAAHGTGVDESVSATGEDVR
jgi:hypothetical protein